jgi:hypothetical protein
MNLRSLLDLDLPPLNDAERRLADLSTQSRRRLLGSLVLWGVAALTLWVLPQVGLALAAGAAAALVATAVAARRRQVLLTRLVQVRSAYRIELVARAGARFANHARRRRLAQWLRKIVRSAEGTGYQASYTAAALEERVLARKQRLLALAAAIEDDDAELHPAGVAIVHRLLTRPGLSPLYNPALDEHILDDTLHRVETCLERAA